MADTGGPEIALIGNSITLSSPGIVKIAGRDILSEQGFLVASVPASSDLAALGSASRPWSDLFLASGAVLNFNSDLVLTHSAGVLTLTTGELALGGHVVSVNGDAVLITQRHRVTTTEMNTGHSLLGAVTGLKYRLVDIGVIAIGGAAAATANATGLAIYGTQTGSVALYTALLAALTQSAFCRPGTTNTSIQADGASFVANDAATAITCKTVSAGNFDLITATHFDVILTYCLEA
jgi:hypothetical protein